MDGEKMKYGVISYSDIYNLGDAIQTYALSRLLPDELFAVDRSRQNQFEGKGLVVNGYCYPNLGPNIGGIYAGIYLQAWSRNKNLNALNKHNKVIGSRDPATHSFLKRNGIRSEMIGCVTSTLPRYDGPREGEINVDAGEGFTQNISASITWVEQWERALLRLDALKKAKSVTTSRLHVALPCLAMGTPVKIPYKCMGEVGEPERLTILTDMGFEYDKFNEIDMTPFAERFKDFLYSKLGISPITPTEKECPIPI